MAFDLRTFQGEHKAWAEHNFGPKRNPIHATIGLLEEAGEIAWAVGHGYEEHEAATDNRSVANSLLLEIGAVFGLLCHNDLKQAQGIRQLDFDARRVAIVEKLSELIERYYLTTRPEIVDTEAERSMALALEECCRNIDADEMKRRVADGIGDVTIFATDLATGLGISVEDAIGDAWNEVRARDWKARPQNGVTA